MYAMWASRHEVLAQQVAGCSRHISLLKSHSCSSRAEHVFVFSSALGRRMTRN